MRHVFGAPEDDECPSGVWLLSEVGTRPLHDRVGWRGISIFLANCQPKLTSSPASRLPAHSSLNGTSLRAVTRNSECDPSGCLGLPAIRRVVDPHPIQDDRQASSHRHGSLRETSPASDGEAPHLQRRATLRDSQQDPGSFDQHPSDPGIAALRNAPIPVDLAGLIARGRQSEVGWNGSAIG